VSFKLNMSAGGLFDMIRPAVIVLSALLSAWVFASARKRGFRVYFAALWAIATFLLTPVILPLYLVARLISQPANNPGHVRFRFVLPLLYLAILLSAIGLYFYRESQRADVHLARAVEAKVNGDRNGTITELQKALQVEDNPHTHKLLALEYLDLGFWSEALSEFRLAEAGGEPDDSISFRIGLIFDVLNSPKQANVEYDRFLQSNACNQPLPDSRCGVASKRKAANEKSN
jgi:tetratricopeptide (TPR) repeat protein